MASSSIIKDWNWLNRTLRSTRWSLVRKMRLGQHRRDPAPAEEFCRCYWYPLYSFLRHAGHSPEDAQDHVQSFLVRLFNEDLLAAAEPERGRLRNYLITLLTRHVSARKERDGAKKRGGGVAHTSLDWQAAEDLCRQKGPMSGTPEEAYRGALASQLVHTGIAALHKHYRATGQLPLFEELLPALEGTLPDSTCAEVAARLGMRPGAVRTAVLRMRERFRLAVKASAATVLGIPDGPLLDTELRDLFCTSSLPSGL